MSLMIFVFLCFLGLFVMFFFILRGQEKIHAALREELAMLRAHMRQLESRISSVPMPGMGLEEQPGRHASVQTAFGQTAFGQTAPGQNSPGQTSAGQAAPGQSAPRQPASAQASSLDRPLTMPAPLNSLSMDSSSTPPAGGLDLHFDPQQDFRR